VIIEQVSIELMIVNPLTKDMPPNNFKNHITQLRFGFMM